MASPGPCTGLNPQFRDHPDLKQLVLHNVTLTGKTLGCGSYGSVEEVAIPGALCAAKKIHDFLSQEDPNWLEKEKADENIQKFVAECKMMGRLRHPNVVQFLGIWFSPKESTLPALYLVMEKMLTSLHDLLEPDTPKPSNAPKPYIPLSVKCSILCDIAQGIAYLHNQSPPVVHRDLSARNVLLNSAMVAKIADMGMARFLPERKNTTMTKAPGASVYMPPEALEDKSKYDTSIDVFSLGVVAIFVLAEEFPSNLKLASYMDEAKGLVARTELERREKYTEKIYNAFPKTHALIRLMESCLEYSPIARPTINEALELLDQAVAGIQDCTHLQVNKLQLLQVVEQHEKRSQLELESMQQKCDAWREEVEKLSPLRDEVAQLHQENARLQQELAHITEDNAELGRQLQEMTSVKDKLEEKKDWEQLIQARQLKETENKLTEYKDALEHLNKRSQLELESMQQKYDAWREEVEKLSPLRDEVAQLHQENARLQQELTQRTYGDNTGFEIIERQLSRPKGEWETFTPDNSHSPASTPTAMSAASFVSGTIGGASSEIGETQTDMGPHIVNATFARYTILSGSEYPMKLDSGEDKDERGSNSSQGSVAESEDSEGESEASVELTSRQEQQLKESLEDTFTDDEEQLLEHQSVSASPHPPSLQPKPHKKMKTWFKRMDRTRASELLEGCVNGTFLCRPTTQEQTKMPNGELHTHTIDIMYQEVQHVRVFKQNGKYGFSPPCTFSSLMELVLYFSEHLLSQDNASLHTTLQFPFFSENKQ